MRNVPSVFQQLMDDVLRGCDKFTKVYIDDVVVHSECWDDHCLQVAEVLRRLEEAGLTANIEKCQWGMGACEFLGLVVGSGRVSPSECKAKAIDKFPRPSSDQDFGLSVGGGEMLG